MAISSPTTARRGRSADDSRRSIEFHPLADIFPLMEGEELDALVADIKAHGLRESIVLLDGKILDGRNRYRACLAAEVEPRFEKHLSAHHTTGEALAFIISKNIHRRHLTAEQKRDLVAKLIKATPEKSDRQIAEVAKASPTTVGTVRAKMEAAGDVSKLDTRRDTKGRKQPAKKTKDRRSKVAAPPTEQPAEHGNGAAGCRGRGADGGADEAEITVREIPVTPPGKTSWRVLVTDANGKVWSDGVRLAGPDEAMAYMLTALWDFSDRESSVIEIRAVESSDAPNVTVPHCTRGPRKGRARVGGQILFAHGTCGIFGWEESDAPARPEPPPPPLVSSLGNGGDPEQSADQRRAEYAKLDGSDPGPIPERLRRSS